MTSFLKFTPADKIAINLASNESARATLVAENTTSGPIAFKVKTTQPKRYLVKPNQGVLAAGASDQIKIQVVPKDRAALANNPSSASSDRFLIQAVTCDESLSKLERESEDFIKELTTLWSTVDKNTPQQSSKFSVAFTTPFGEDVPDAESVIGKERLKELLTRTAGDAGSSPQEIMTMRKKYDDLVSYTVSLTAERDRLKADLEQTKKEYNKAMVARLSAEKGGSSAAGVKSAFLSRNEATAGSRFSLLQILLVAILAFVLGKFLEL